MFPIQLTAWREAKGITQEALAQMTGISRPNLSAMERNRRDVTLSTLKKIAQALEIKSGQLLDEAPRVIGSLDRHDVDAVARAVVNGKRVLSPPLNKMADDMASLVINLLEGHKTPGFKQVRRLSRHDPQRRLIKQALYGVETVQRVLKRIPKYF